MDDLSKLFAIALCYVFAVFAVAGLIGNLLVIIVILRNTHLQTTTNILIISLFCAHILFIIGVIPFSVVENIQVLNLHEQDTVYPYPFGALFCSLSHFLQFVLCYVTVYTLAIMSLDLYIAVRFRSTASKALRTPRHVVSASITVWAAATIINSPNFFDFQSKLAGDVIEDLEGTANGNYTICINHEMLYQTTKARVSYIVLFVLVYVLPLALMCGLYGCVLLRVLSNRVQNARSVRARRRVIRLVVLIVSVFAVSWLPLHVMFMLEVFGAPHSRALFFAHMGAQFLTYANACMNPLIYVFLLKNFWNAVLATLLCRRAMLGTHQHNARRVHRNGNENGNGNGNTTGDQFGGTHECEEDTARRVVSDRDFSHNRQQAAFLEPPFARGRIRSLDVIASGSGLSDSGLSYGLQLLRGSDGRGSGGCGRKGQHCTQERGGRRATLDSGSLESVGGMEMHETTRSTLLYSPNSSQAPNLWHFKGNVSNSNARTVVRKLDRGGTFELDESTQVIQERTDHPIMTSPGQTNTENSPRIEHLYKKRFSLRFSDEAAVLPNNSNGTLLNHKK